MAHKEYQQQWQINNALKTDINTQWAVTVAVCLVLQRGFWGRLHFLFFGIKPLVGPAPKAGK